ncbi:hypothetical protein [Paenibacillus elgii]|uniref:hypothetical protein n=1 Tax=Paenibacillus elgii TaxID=189691 RepID=UPI0020421927|nr:hypothetical protein [Paenibacillus elgii]MCM3270988.1 hypothetical protein [Paenibacillus elgii]GMX66380.1 hypothetical protein Elgi_56520 [Paenibacillus elgii]
MKKLITHYEIFSMILLMILTLTSGCSAFTSKPLPQSSFNIVGKEQSYEAKIFSYAWGLKTEYGKSSAVGTQYDTVTVPAKSKLKISFNPPPKKYGNVHEIFGEDITESKTIEDYSTGITVPDKPGTYTYNYNATWDEGGVAYVIRIKVEE